MTAKNRELLTERVKELLQQASPAKPKVSREIERETGLAGAEVREIVRDLRRAGIPVCIISNKKEQEGGYYISQDPHEISETIENLTSRRDSLSITIRALNNTLRNIINEESGQQRLF